MLYGEFFVACGSPDMFLSFLVWTPMRPALELDVVI